MGGCQPGCADAGREGRPLGRAVLDLHPEQREVTPVYIQVLHIQGCAAGFNGNRMLLLLPMRIFLDAEGTEVEIFFLEGIKPINNKIL